MVEGRGQACEEGQRGRPGDDPVAYRRGRSALSRYWQGRNKAGLASEIKTVRAATAVDTEEDKARPGGQCEEKGE